MLIFLRFKQWVGKAKRPFKSNVKWIAPLLILTMLYTMSIVLLPYFEGPDSPFVSKWTTSWWFGVTLTTVGYGDFYPATMGGQIVAFMVMFMGIGTAAFLLTEGAMVLIQTMIERQGRKMKGLMQLKKENHVLIIEYVPGKTEKMIEQLELSGEQEIVLYADREENPLPGCVDFVRGKIPSKEALERACANKAKLIAIYSEDDALSLAAAVAVLSYHTNNGVEVRVHVTENSQAMLIQDMYRGQNGSVEIIESMSALMMVQHKGVPAAFAELASHSRGEDEMYTVLVPEGVHTTIGELFMSLKTKHNATIIGTILNGTQDLNPKLDLIVSGGMEIMLIAENEPKIDW